MAALTPLKLDHVITPAQAAEEAPQRIVSVGGAVTEIVYALGEEDRLVARDTTSIFPQDAAALPDVGYIRALSPEGVLSVGPDLILLLEGSGPPETVELLQKAGIPIASIPEAFTAEGIAEKVLAVGEALGKQDQAADLAAGVKADLSEAHSQADGKAAHVKVLFVLSTQGGRILASGTDTAADGILKLAGAQNAMQAFSGYKPLSDEAILQAAPDVILMMDRTGDHEGADIFEHPSVAATPAGLNKRIIRMNGQYLLGFGPRTAGAVSELASALAAYEIVPPSQ
ncbi:hemin ABC transporter substrate-binding protein [Roseibium sp. RKSG952]|nr:ABC transporter substrate-binding protein [Roseibium sp. RKSG952]MTI00180.1 hemin ABC transporter substrate-binding protein [Roseibium sp. RKSG952]